MVRLGALLVVVASLLALACGGDSGSDPESATSTVTTTAQPASGTPTGSADATGELPELGFQRVFPNVTINEPTSLVQAPDGRWFALDQTGRVFTFGSTTDSRPTEVLNITDRVNDAGNEEGLLGLAMAPDFASSGRFYVNYTAADPRRTVISRFTLAGSTASPSSEQIILEVAQPFSNHNGGQLAFGADGFLYIGMGDGGSGRDPQGNGQNLDVLLGKILRIDVSQAANGLNYTIPTDNPFVGRNDARGEVWAYGFRNPWRFSFDSATQALWAGDVGQNAREEVDLVTKGGNYGWVIMEGSQCLTGNSCDRTGLTLPVVDYATANGRCSVTGGYVYRGSAIPALVGAYVYGDYCSGEVWAVRFDGTRATQQGLIADLGGALSSFAVDLQGEVYALNYGSGTIFKLTQP